MRAVLESLRVLPEEEIGLTEALDRVLAEDIYADINVPRFDNSAMDGYAVKSLDTMGASKSNPRIFEVIYDLKAGFLTSSDREKSGNKDYDRRSYSPGSR